jgi:hypothetical protein
MTEGMTYKEYFNKNNKVEGLTYQTYIKRITRKVKSLGRPLTPEEAISKPMKREVRNLTYRKKKYNSARQLFNLIDPIDKEPEISESTFSHRLSEIFIDRPELTEDEAIFIALNAKKYEKLNLDVNHYRKNVLIRKGAEQKEIQKTIDDEMRGG